MLIMLVTWLKENQPVVTVNSWERIWNLGLAKDKQLLLCVQQKHNTFQLQVVVHNYSGWNISWKTIRLMLTVFPSFVIILLSYPHFGPKNTHSNFSAIFWYFQIHRVFTVLQTHILLLLPPIFLHSKPFKVFSYITGHLKGSLRPLHISLHFIPSFLHKTIQKGILVISYKGTHFSPYNLSLGLFNLFAWIIDEILYKSVLVLHLSQSGSF